MATILSEADARAALLVRLYAIVEPETADELAGAELAELRRIVEGGEAQLAMYAELGLVDASRDGKRAKGQAA